MSKKRMLDSLQVPTPCDEAWENMIGGSRKRFCLGCEKDVYNLSAMSQSEAVKFAAKNEGKVCIRYARLPDGRIATTDRIFHQIPSRKVVAAAGVIAASVSLSAMAYAQGKPLLPQNKEIRSSESRNKNDPKRSQISFTLVDVTGAVVPDAEVTLTNKKTSKESLTLSNQDDVAQFLLLERGHYELNVLCCGFEKYERDIQIKELVEPNIKVTLNAGGAVGSFIFDWSDIPLFRAIAQKDNNAVKSAIASGFDVNTRDSYKNTALMVAVDHCNLEIVRLLLEHGARVNDKDAEKRTPILKVNCDEDKDQDGAQIFRLLISNGADVNVRNEDGQTLLMQASENGSTEGVRLLLGAGAKPNLKDPDGETAYEKAGSDEIKKLLIQYGARPK